MMCRLRFSSQAGAAPGWPGGSASRSSASVRWGTWPAHSTTVSQGIQVGSVRCSPWLEFCTEADLALILEQQTCLDAVAECAPGVEYEFTYAVAQCKKTNSKLTKDCLDTVTR